MFDDLEEIEYYGQVMENEHDDESEKRELKISDTSKDKWKTFSARIDSTFSHFPNKDTFEIHRILAFNSNEIEKYKFRYGLEIIIMIIYLSKNNIYFTDKLKKDLFPNHRRKLKYLDNSLPAVKKILIKCVK